MATEQMTVRSVRMTVKLDNELQTIAKYEDRTISKIIQRFLQQGVARYKQENPDMYLELEAESRADFETEMIRKGYTVRGLND